MTKKIKKTGRVLPRFCLLCVWKFRLFKKSKRMWTEGRHSKTYVIYAEIDHNKPTQPGIFGPITIFLVIPGHSAQCWMSRATKKPWKKLENHKTKSKKLYMRENGFMKLEFPYHEANICNGGVKMHFWKKEQKCTFTRCQKGVKYFPHLGSKQTNKQN